MIPDEGGPTVKLSELPKQIKNMIRLNQKMVMIWENAPRDCSVVVLGQQLEQICRKGIHASWREPNVSSVVKACCRHVEMSLSLAAAMRRTMPRMAIFRAPL